MRHFIRAVCSIVFVLFSFGIALPRLISYPDTIVVLAGFGYALFVLPGILYVINYPYIPYLKSLFKA